MTSTMTGRFPSLDGLRATAIVLVILQHLSVDTLSEHWTTSGDFNWGT